MTANAKIRGSISGRSRQIDVLVEDRRFTNPAARIVVEAKLHGRKIDIGGVEAFEGKLRDVNASFGVLVASGGFTSSAERRADDAITILLLDYDELLDGYDWRFGRCFADGCKQSDAGSVIWSIDRVDPAGPGWLMYRYGKCTVCHAFHVLCRDCGTEFAVPDGLTCACDCGNREWGAIPESEASGHQAEPESTWLMLRIDGDFIGLQRKPIGKVKAQKQP